MVKGEALLFLAGHFFSETITEKIIKKTCHAVTG
jgi:hypothetical protein